MVKIGNKPEPIKSRTALTSVFQNSTGAPKLKSPSMQKSTSSLGIKLAILWSNVGKFLLMGGKKIISLVPLSRGPTREILTPMTSLLRVRWGLPELWLLGLEVYISILSALEQVFHSMPAFKFLELFPQLKYVCVNG